MSIKIPENYQPSDEEPFMNVQQIEYFRRRLLSWRDQLVQESAETLNNLQEKMEAPADPLDSASEAIDEDNILRARERDRKLLNKINDALRRIEDGSYGYCDETGEPISIKRLQARPIATLTLEAQERHERRERLQKEQ